MDLMLSLMCKNGRIISLRLIARSMEGPMKPKKKPMKERDMLWPIPKSSLSYKILIL